MKLFLKSIEIIGTNFNIWKDKDLKYNKSREKKKTYPRILSLTFVKSLRLSFSTCLISFWINNRRSTSSNVVTSTTLVPLSFSSLPSSNSDDLNRSNVGSLSITAQIEASSTLPSSSTAIDELLLKLKEVCRRNDELKPFLITHKQLKLRWERDGLKYCNLLILCV